MTGQELLVKLSKFTEEELQLPVYVYADHGQSHMQASDVNLETATELGYDLEDYFVHPDDRKDHDESELLKFIGIE